MICRIDVVLPLVELNTLSPFRLPSGSGCEVSVWLNLEGDPLILQTMEGVGIPTDVQEMLIESPSFMTTAAWLEVVNGRTSGERWHVRCNIRDGTLGAILEMAR